MFFFVHDRILYVLQQLSIFIRLYVRILTDILCAIPIYKH